jgi:hypothetical protein
LVNFLSVTAPPTKAGFGPVGGIPTTTKIQIYRCMTGFIADDEGDLVVPPFPEDIREALRTLSGPRLRFTSAIPV